MALEHWNNELVRDAKKKSWCSKRGGTLEGRPLLVLSGSVPEFQEGAYKGSLL